MFYKGSVRYNAIPGWGIAAEVWREGARAPITTCALAGLDFAYDSAATLRSHLPHMTEAVLREHDLDAETIEWPSRLAEVPEAVWARYSGSGAR